jgi:hypothetical protein
MNKATLLSAVAFLALQPVGAKAQNTGSAQLHSSVARKSSTKPTILSGELSGDGKTLRADRDRRIWKVSNPEILSGIDVRHVRVKAHVDAALGQIRILWVGAIVDERAGIKLDDAAFRR